MRLKVARLSPFACPEKNKQGEKGEITKINTNEIRLTQGGVML